MMTDRAAKSTKKSRAVKTRPRRSVIEILPSNDDDFYEAAISIVLSLIKNNTSGGAFIMRDGGPMYRVTVERIEEAKS